MVDRNEHIDITQEDKIRIINELRADPKISIEIARNLEARRRGDIVHWDDLKAELELEA